ncbi:MAG: phage holin family protein [Thermodesulfobacteriota bacterium]
MDNKTVSRNYNLQDETLAELLKQLGGHSAILVREEIKLLKQEFVEKTQALRNGAIMVVIGFALVMVAFATLWAALIIWLTAYWAPDLAAAVTGGGLALVGLIITLIGIKLVHKTTAAPMRTVEALEGRTENG